MSETNKEVESANVEEGEGDVNEEVEEEFQVEKIIKVRVRGGKKEYFLKWKGYPHSENTWEPEENLDCPELIKQFEDSRKLETRKSTGKRSIDEGDKSPTRASDVSSENGSKKLTGSPQSKKLKSAPVTKKTEEKGKVVQPNRSKGFSRGLEADKIIGATDSNGELMFLIKWKNSEEADLVPAREANVKCPQVVIKFYEERLTWHTPTNAATTEKVSSTGDAN
uniref:Heterochromatin protein 1-like protein 1 n=2 Tax=Schmidtea mediterranea TaxID=79327 RepID=M9NKU4_SCHMD|nr:heterochromatin protein 1-like protein 1 [Schmidtea mediterranea]